MFWCVLYHLDAFGTVMLPYETRGKMGRASAKVCATKSRRIFFATNAPNPPHWTLNSCFGVFYTVMVHLRPFGCLAKLDAKGSELVQKFVPRSRVGNCCNERTRSTPFDPKLMFWCVSYHLVAFGTIMLPCYHLHAFGTVWLPYKTRGKTFQISVKVRATRSRRSFSRRTHLIHPIGP